MGQGPALDAFTFAALRQHTANSVDGRPFIPISIEVDDRFVGDGLSAVDIPALVVIGDPGAGKTELMRWVSSELQRQYLKATYGKIPLLIDARSLAGVASVEEFADRLAEQMRRFGLTVTMPDTFALLEAGALHPFIDGFDEGTAARSGDRLG